MSDLKDNPFTALFGGAGATEAYLNGEFAQQYSFFKRHLIRYGKILLSLWL